MVLLVHYLSLKNGDVVFKKYRWLLYANLITAYGMLVSFIVQGYGFFSINFSTLSIFVSYFFAVCYWRDLNKMKQEKVSHWWFKSALLFSVISSIGAFALAYLMVNRISHQNWYLSSLYFFLHFQYNGWFLFAGMGLLVSKIETKTEKVKLLKIIFWLFSLACIPAYFLSVLWMPLPSIILGIIIAAVIAQLAAWILLLKLCFKNKFIINEQFSRCGKLLLLLSATAFTIKLLLQSGSVHPALSQLSYGFRPIIIGYLHLVLLGVTSIFILGYIIGTNLIYVNKITLAGIIIFVSGVIINELLLMVQGVQGLNYNSVPFINIYLFMTAVILFLGIGLMVISGFKQERF